MITALRIIFGFQFVALHLWLLLLTLEHGLGVTVISWPWLLGGLVGASLAGAMVTLLWAGDW